MKSIGLYHMDIIHRNTGDGVIGMNINKTFVGPLGVYAKGLLVRYGLLVLAFMAPAALVVGLIGTVLGFW